MTAVAVEAAVGLGDLIPLLASLNRSIRWTDQPLF